MLNKTVFSKVGWRKYLDPTDSPRVKKFLKSSGRKVLTQIVDGIQDAIENDVAELVILVHPNVSSVVVVPSVEYDNVLTHSLQFFKSLEEYNQCSKIIKIKKKLKTPSGNLKEKVKVVQ